MVVERTCPLIETSSVPRVPKSEAMEVEMMAELSIVRQFQGFGSITDTERFFFRVGVSGSILIHCL